MIQVQNLTHRYGDRTALSNVTFEVRKGEIFGLLGPNGGGKSTLFRILATMMVPTAGRALIAGHDVVRDPAAVRRQVGVVFQTQSLDNQHVVFSTSVYADELAALPAGIPLAVFSMALTMEDVLLRGTYLGIRRLGGVRVGLVQVDWVYNPDLPAGAVETGGCVLALILEFINAESAHKVV